MAGGGYTGSLPDHSVCADVLLSDNQLLPRVHWETADKPDGVSYAADFCGWFLLCRLCHVPYNAWNGDCIFCWSMHVQYCGSGNQFLLHEQTIFKEVPCGFSRIYRSDVCVFSCQVHSVSIRRRESVFDCFVESVV